MRRPIAFTLGSGVVLAGFLLIYFVFQRVTTTDDRSTVQQDRSAGFREYARNAGIHFRMAFLPGEQGEKFKINLYDHGAGVAIGDYDNDGHDDIYFVNQLGRNALYMNKGNGTFLDVTQRAGVALGDRICVAATFADYDNDGDQDLFVTSTRGGNVLFRNRGDGTLEDVTKAAGVELVAHSQTAVFFDYDNDGFLDLFVTNTARWTSEQLDAAARYYPGAADLWQLAASTREHNVFYRNNGNGTFTDVTTSAGLSGQGWGGDAAVFDYDGDGYLDLLVTNMFGASQLYRNNRGQNFVDVTRQALGRTSWGAIGSKVFDFNNDGRLDLYIVDMHSDMWMPYQNNREMESLIRDSSRKKYTHVTGPLSEISPQAFTEMENQIADSFGIRYADVLFGNSFFKNLGNGKFEEISDRANLETFWPWGIATGDFDNNGYEDVFLPAGMGYPYFYWPSSLMMNEGNETFTDRAEQLGIEPPARGQSLGRLGGQTAVRSSRCAATADFDGDGRLEIVVNNFNDYPYLFKNDLPRRNFIAVRLTGTKSNRDAIGALVKVHAKDTLMVRQVHPAGGYLSQSSRTLHFGLGSVEAVDRMEIRWPSGALQVVEKPAINRLHVIEERPTTR